MHDSLGALHITQRVGMPIIPGTDRQSPPLGLGELHVELAIFVAEGLTPLSALQAATLNPAKVLHATDSLGTIARGKVADLVLLDANPLADITNTAMIRAVVADCGVAPGMVNVLAAEGIRRLDRAERVKIFVGGLPQQPEPPLNYQIVYSLEGALDYYTTPSWVLREGQRRQVEALSEIEMVDFPASVGTLEAFHTAGGISTLPFTYAGQVETMEYKTLRYPGHAALMRSIRALGLLDQGPVAVNDQAVVPRDVFIAAVSPKLTKPEGHDLLALQVEVSGDKAGEPAQPTRHGRCPEGEGHAAGPEAVLQRWSGVRHLTSYYQLTLE